MRINKKSDLPKWFDIEKYNKIKTLPDDEIAYLILCRCNDLLAGRYNKEGYFDNVLYCGELCSDDKIIKRSGNECKISSSPSIIPISIGHLNIFKNYLFDIGVNIEDEYVKYNHLSAYEMHNMSITSWSGVVCGIDLLTKQDETIINELRVLLKKWRRELDFEEAPSLLNNSWEIIKSKIINYNVFAFFDLQLWQFATGNSITGGVLSVTLYPEGEYDSTQIAQTIKPFSDKLFTYETLEKIEREISNK
ncbi:DUF6387 family protein [Xenorhabdus bovienii]|uniref:Uncharacterized protein n=1 Tax=Xenorhabdus bovienii TaxID=40576 RepID=A0A0B6XBD2_XENBV|nr:DUF6387 family protein [Xenorhabdus bovienii]CDM90048.1 conserved protein of unknown function [Xenorhabdus bovienii]